MPTPSRRWHSGCHPRHPLVWVSGSGHLALDKDVSHGRSRGLHALGAPKGRDGIRNTAIFGTIGSINAYKVFNVPIMQPFRLGVCQSKKGIIPNYDESQPRRLTYST
jgi:hypothetical protein